MDIATELQALIDTLLPGEDRFPAASQVGVHGLVAERLRALIGPDALTRVAEAIRQSGGPLASVPGESRAGIVARLEQEHGALFASVRMATYLSYYQNPIVVDAVRSLGRVYNHAPQPDGYAMALFDPTDPLQAPTHKRGRYTPTDAVERVNLSALPKDPTAPEEWG